MGGQGDSEAGTKGRIGAAAKLVFLAAIEGGAGLEEAARAASFSLPGFYGARARDPDFAAAWAEALDVRADTWRITPNNKRRLQVRRMRHAKFNEKRRERFLAHFAGTCDARAAARAAGVDHSTVYKLSARDAGFAARFQAALEQGYAQLEAEAVRQRIVAQERVRESLEDGLLPTGEVAAEFERVMKLLARWDRRGGGPGPRRVSHGHRQATTFEEAIDALHKRLQALDIPILRLPWPDEGQAEGG